MNWLETIQKSAIQVVPKLWGTEYWLTNQPLYCAKLLELQPGYQCSLHCHHLKSETFIVLDGSIVLEQQQHDNYWFEILDAGSTAHISPFTYHRFACAPGSSPAYLLEVSTHHDDADVERLEESSPINEPC